MAGCPSRWAELADDGGGRRTSVVKGLVKLGAVSEEEAPRDTALSPARPRPAAARTLTARSGGGGRDACARRSPSGTYGTTLLQGRHRLGQDRGLSGGGRRMPAQRAAGAGAVARDRADRRVPDRVEARFGARPGRVAFRRHHDRAAPVWRMVGEGGAQLVVGARSALFLPFRDLGLIVVDEEHDTSYKQEEGVLYNARDMAVLRAAICGAQVVLASATPSLESWANAEAGKYRRLDLTARFGAAVMPEMRAIDMRAEDLPASAGSRRRCSAAVDARLEQGEQALLVPQPPRLCAGDALPGLRASDRLRSLRRADGRASVPEAAGLPSMRRRRSRCPRSAPPARSRASWPPSARGWSGWARRCTALFPEARVAVLSLGPLRLGPGAEGADRGDCRGRRRYHHRHAAGGEGAQLSRC